MGTTAQIRRRKRSETTAASVLCLFAGALTVFGQRTDSAFSYDLERFKTIDPALMLYQETDAIAVSLETPRALAVGPDSTLFVAGERSLVVLGEDGAEQQRIGLSDSATCIAVGASGTIFLGVGDHVAVYAADGAKQSDWMGLGEQAILTSIAVSAQFVFVADAGQHRVFVFDHSGRLTAQLGGKDASQGVPGFVIPSPHFDVVPGAGGTVWVVNPGYQRVENYGIDGAPRSHWGEAGMELDGFCGCCNPVHIARLPDGSFVTGEKGLARVKLYDEKGALQGVVAGPEQFEGDTFGVDLAVDPKDGRILVLDAANQRVRVFVKKDEQP